MAFVFDAGRLAGLTVELLRRQIVLPATVQRVAEADFRGTGGSVRLRVPQRRTAREQTTPGDQITTTAVAESAVTFQLRHIYDATTLTDETSTLEIRDFARQVLAPLSSSVAERAEEELAEAMNGLTADPDIRFPATPDIAADEGVVIAAREKLTTNLLPPGDRYLAVHPSIASRLLRSPRFTAVDASGSDSALRNGRLGRLFGLDIIETAALDPGTAVAYHASAFAFAFVSPADAPGAASAQAQVDGVALRIVQDFDVSRLAEVVAVSTFCGASVVEASRAVRVTTASS
jgi:hypothetical protein